VEECAKANILGRSSLAPARIFSQSQKIKTIICMMNYSLFFDPSTFSDRKISHKEIGSLHLSTGELVAADPIYQPHRSSFTEKIMAGDYPVSIYTSTETQTIGLVRVSFRPDLPTTWEMAVLPNQSLDKLEEGYYFGLDSESGLAAIGDKLSMQFLMAAQATVESQLGEDFISYYDNVLIDELNINDGSYTHHFPSPDSKLDVMIFSTGWEQGSFACYWGRNVEGDICSLVMDFRLFQE
jgi:hypothetical protein